MTDFIAILRGAVAVADKRVKPHSGTFAPEGILLHHTATKGAGLSTVQRGRPGLAGPLCNLNPARDGTINVVSDGLAWHAGSGSSRVLADLRDDLAPTGDARTRGLKDDTSGNRYLIGFEIDNDGVGEKYPAEQVRAVVLACAALCRHFGWSANRVIAHKEWTARKPDPSTSTFTMPQMRASVAAALAGRPDQPEDDMTEDQAEQLERLEAKVDHFQAFFNTLEPKIDHFQEFFNSLEPLVQGIDKKLSELLARDT